VAGGSEGLRDGGLHDQHRRADRTHAGDLGQASAAFMGAVPIHQAILNLLQLLLNAGIFPAVDLTVAHAGVPIGTLKFKMQVESQRQDHPNEIRGDKARRFSRAFLSYASDDRVRVLNSAQMLRAANIEVFQDVLSLDPGERWEKRLYTEIDNCDLFLLFWSDAAGRSKWVMKEAKYALDCCKRNDNERPDVKPIILEGPPIPKPPRGFGSIHFNDKFRYFITAAELEKRARKKAQGEGPRP
jgi:hypothetical protein